VKPAAHIQSCIDILDLLKVADRPSDTVISAYFRSRRFIGSKDRAAISAMTYDILRHHARLSWWASYMDREDATARVQVILYLSLVKRQVIAAIRDVFSGDKFAPPRLDDVEAQFLEKMEGRTLFHPEMPPSAMLECPPWAYSKLEAAFGSRLKDELAAMMEPAPLDLRVNSLKASREDVLEQLKALGLVAEATAYSPFGLRLQSRPAITQTDLYKNGLIEIQDEGSQLVAALVQAKAGMSVVDFCAGAGGKTLALAATMNNKGRIVACDVMDRRLERSRERFRRAGAHNIELHPLKNENDQWVKRNEGKYDCVLVDAPCSGTGTWRRNPDARWKNLGPRLDELLGLQSRILISAARLVKAGGRLVYATCSLLPEENEAQVEAFLAAQTAFRLVDSQAAEITAEKSFLKTTPARHGTDGFFGAVMERNTA
jgi:16S rRNA (cytosine967-C5)-methyltransferase